MKHLMIGIAGVAALLALCLYAFSGTMAAATWQLTSTIWIFIWWRITTAREDK